MYNILLDWVLEDVHFDLTEPIIEGIGNEVLLSLFVFTILAIIIYYPHWNRDPQDRYLLHPEHAEDIQIFRQNVGRLSEEEIERRIAEASNRDDKTCAICISNANYACLTNCGHLFCCECIVGYWNHRGNLFSPITCAICRTPVTILLPVSWPSRQDAETPEQYTSSLHRLDDYNRRFSGDRPWTEYIADIPVLIPFLFRNMAEMNGFMLVFRLRVLLLFVAAAVYTLVPLDIIPEGAYGLSGFLDDIFVIALICVYLAIALRYFLARRGEQAQQREHAQQRHNAQHHPPPVSPADVHPQVPIDGGLLN